MHRTPHSSDQGFPHLLLLCLAKFEFQLIATVAVSLAELLRRIYKEQSITWQNEKGKNRKADFWGRMALLRSCVSDIHSKEVKAEEFSGEMSVSTATKLFLIT